MILRGVSGYAALTGPTGFKREADTFTCGHCNTVVHIKPRASLEDLGGRCSICDQLICPRCVGKSCDPLEEKLRRWEAAWAARRSYGS